MSVHKVLNRISMCLKIFQFRHVTISLLFPCALDLIKSTTALANKLDEEGDEDGERYIGRYRAEFEAEFKEDLVNDFLKLCTLCDP